ncbi:hypothetical protein [Flavobacterium sp. ZE23DGlu08]|uniref:hypothetical protein n=1 Tax=Flavobacterium sp. ZE23DGlu08 TaxID=3059026 RepID=UPI00265E7304|nr:hypothetical protein [Flavobacterium sp. ZE23DGlu08]WKL42772.1 hypothetical protein Q1W72_10405 [Flavobacterium sp. ZE23DGlu08]
MRKNYFSKKVLQACVLFFMIITTNVFAQVGIGTITPHASSVLDVSSTTQGMLTPRMTTVQRAAIASPADGLMVYDTDLKAFHYYNSSAATWTIINSSATGRLKFKRIRSTDVLATVLATELAAGGGTKYVLDSTTHYEINGTIVFNFPIDLNNASLIGVDANEDIIVRSSGFLFDGTTGGTVKNLTISGACTVFNLIGSGNTQTILFRDSIVSGATSVGTISGFNLVFFSIINYSGNTTGITYTNITRVLLSNTAWFGNNLGTFERFTGTFSLLQKQGGFCEVNGAAIGVDVFANPTIIGDAVMETVVFTGTPTTGKFVNAYTTGTFAGYNFNNKWNVRCSGIPTEVDASATGEFSVNYPPGSGAPITITNSGTPSKINLATTSATTSNFRFTTTTNDAKMVYLGLKKRIIKFSGSLSFVADSNGKTGIYIFYIAKNGVVIGQTKIYGFTNSTTDTVAIPLSGSTELTTNDFIEVFADYLGTAGQIKVTSLTLTAF